MSDLFKELTDEQLYFLCEEFSLNEDELLDLSDDEVHEIYEELESMDESSEYWPVASDIIAAIGDSL